MCQTCGKVYSCKSTLNRHRRVHLNKGIYRCCGRYFQVGNEIKEIIIILSFPCKSNSFSIPGMLTRVLFLCLKNQRRVVTSYIEKKTTMPKLLMWMLSEKSILGISDVKLFSLFCIMAAQKKGVGILFSICEHLSC